MKKIIIFLGVLLFGAIGFSQNFTFGNDFLNNHETQELEIGLFDFVSCPLQYELVKNETKKVWVNDGWGGGKIACVVIGGSLAFVGGLILIPAAILEEITALICGGVGAGLGVVTLIIGLCLPNDGHYETRYVSISNNIDLCSSLNYSQKNNNLNNTFGIRVKI